MHVVHLDVNFVVTYQLYRSTAKAWMEMWNKDMLKKSLLLNIGVDHITIPEEQFSLGFLPPVEATDFLSYLVLETFFLYQATI